MNVFLQVEPSNEIRNKLREFTKRDGYDYYNSRTHEGMMRNLMIRTSSLGEIMVVVIFNRDEKQLIEAVMKFLDEEFPNLTSLQYVVNTKFNDSIYDQDLICYKGRSYILEDLDGLKFRIGPKSFFSNQYGTSFGII